MITEENTSNLTWVFVIAIVLVVGMLAYRLVTFHAPEPKPVPTVTFDPSPWNDTIAELRTELECSALERKQLIKQVEHLKKNEHAIVSARATSFIGLSPAAADALVVHRHLHIADSIRTAGGSPRDVAF